MIAFLWGINTHIVFALDVHAIFVEGEVSPQRGYFGVASIRRAPLTPCSVADANHDVLNVF